MNIKGQINASKGVLLLALLLAAPFVLAGLSRVTPPVLVTVTDNGQNYSALMEGQDVNNTTVCQDADGGFDPLFKSDMNAIYTDRNNMLVNYMDHCDGNYLIEYACGSQILVNGQSFPNNSYAFRFNCADLNMVCSAGKCV